MEQASKRGLKTFAIVDVDLDSNAISTERAGCTQSGDPWIGAAKLVPLDPSKLILRIIAGQDPVKMRVFGSEASTVTKVWIHMGKAGWTRNGVEQKIYLFDLLAEQGILDYCNRSKTRPVTIPPRMRLVIPEHINWMDLSANTLYLEGLATRFGALPSTRVIVVDKPIQLLKHMGTPFGISYEASSFAQVDVLWKSSIPYHPVDAKPKLGPIQWDFSQLEDQSMFPDELFHLNILKYHFTNATREQMDSQLFVNLARYYGVKLIS